MPETAASFAASSDYREQQAREHRPRSSNANIVQDPVLTRQYREAIKRAQQRGFVNKERRVARQRRSDDLRQTKNLNKAEQIISQEEKKEDSEEGTVEPEEEEAPSISQATYLCSCQTLGVRLTGCILRELAQPKLSIKYHHLGQQGLRAAAVALVNNTVVTHVDFTSNDGGPKGAIHVAEMLRENLYVSELILAENLIGTVGVQAICDAVRDNRTLQYLNLAGNRLGEGDARFFWDVFDANTTLKRLDLSGNKFGSIGGVILAGVIDRCDNLHEINLSWNQLRHRGAAAIAMSLAMNDSIKKVDLSYNGFADAGPALGNMLAENNAMTYLDLTSNRICDNCVNIVASGLKKNVALKSLLIGKNPYVPKSAFKILEAVGEMETEEMKDLDLADQPVELEFTELLHKVREKRQLFMAHGTVINAPPVEDEDSNRAMDVENSDPMMMLMECISQKRLRISDLFTKLDKDENQSLSKQEFIRGLQSLNIPMTAKSIDALIKSLDINGNGEIDFLELMEGHKEYKKKLALLKEPVVTRETKEIAKIKTAVTKLMKMQKMAEITSVLQPLDTLKLLSKRTDGKVSRSQSTENAGQDFADHDAEEIERAAKIAVMAVKQMTSLVSESKKFATSTSKTN